METIYVSMSDFAKLRYLFSQAFLLAILKINLWLVVLFVFLPFVSLAQTERASEPISIHELVGYRIDPDEFTHYKVSKWVQVKKRNLLYVEIFERSKDRYEMVFHLKDDTEVVERIDKAIISTLRSNIEKEGRKLLQVIDLMSAAMNEGEIVDFEIMTQDESIRKVQLIQDIGESLIVENAGVPLGIPKEDILRIEFEGRIYKAGFVNEYLNPFPDKYVGAFSAIPMQKGQVYAQLNGVTMPGINVGLSDNVSASLDVDFLLPIMINTFFNLFGAENVLSGVIATGNLRTGFALKDKFYLGAGVDVLSLPSILDEKPFRAMFPYVVATRGTREDNISLRLGSLLTNYTSSLNAFHVDICGIKRLGKGFSFVSENRFLGSFEYNSIGVLTKQGLRIASRKVIVDFGVYTGFAGAMGNSQELIAASAGTTDPLLGSLGLGLFILARRTL